MRQRQKSPTTMFRSTITTLALLGGLSACTGGLPFLEPAAVPVPPDQAPADVAMAPDTRFASCRALTITGEDLSVPFAAGEDPVMVEHRLIAEAPSNPHEMLLGLQDRASLHPDTAMLLEFDGEHNPVLWMKNTPASLDMAFIDKNGAVFYLEAGTEPNSTRFLTPEEPDPIATHVLELPAGRAQALGIFPGLSTITLGRSAPCASFRGPVVAG